MRGMAGEEEKKVSGGVGLVGRAVIALWLVVWMSVGVAVQLLWEIFVAAVYLVGGALRVVQVGAWLVYLVYL